MTVAHTPTSGRQERPTGFAMIPRWLLRDPGISMNAKMVFLVLSSHVDRDGVCWPSQKLIAEEAGLGLRTVERALAELRELGLLVSRTEGTSRGGRRAVYRLLVSLSGKGQADPVPPDEAGGSGHTGGTAPASQAVLRERESVEREKDTPASAGGGGALPLGAAFEPPEPEPSKPTAQDLVARWVDGHNEANDTKPHRAEMRRVSGQMQNLAKSCGTDEEWRRARQAAYDAGKSGAVDPVPFLSRRVSRFEKPKTREQQMFDEGWM